MLVAVAFLLMVTVAACSSFGSAVETVYTPTDATAAPESDPPESTASVDPTAPPTNMPAGQVATGIPPTPSPAADQTPINTPPSPSPTVVPMVTKIPTPMRDDRFGVIAAGPARDWQVQNLQSTWFIDYDSDPGDAPPGTNKVPFIQVAPGLDRIPSDELASLVLRVPGSYWYIGGEPNVAAQGNITPEAFVDEFDYYATEIRRADATARIMGPSILNWDFTCTGCGGFRSGESWMRGFVDAYVASHGGDSPPIDAWTIDAYPLTWDTVPMTNWKLVRDQILGFRQYLVDEVPGHATTPIWVTELASHWAYPAWVVEDGALALPSDLDIEADYLWDEMESYMDGILGWLKTNGSAANVERWFVFKGFADIPETVREGYAGIYFYEDGSVGAPLNQLGEVYSDYISGRR